MIRFLTSGEAIDLLLKEGCSPLVIRHCKTVSKLAVELSKKLRCKKIKVDVDLVRIGGLLHDIGRSKTHKIDHAVIGAEILCSLKMPVPLINIVERHIGSGISIVEAVKLGLTNRNFIPDTLEEKIVSYADKLVEGNHVVSFDIALKKIIEDLGESHIAVDRFKAIHFQLSQKLGE